MIFETAAAKAAATAVLAGSATLGVGVAASDCPSGQEMTVWGCAVVKTAPDETIRRGTGTISATTVAVTFRDENGNRTDSGLGAEDQFEWLGGRKPGKNGDGQLIEVKQITTGKGGWGSLYQGWIPAKYTQIPSMFN
jgi:hypothetical protein